MLKENCKVGMKVNTVGDTFNSPRRNSDSCRREERDGYITVMFIYEDHVRVGYTGTSGKFNYSQVHPYWGDK